MWGEDQSYIPGLSGCQLRETTVSDTAGAMKTPSTQVLVSTCHSQIQRKQEVDELGEELYKVSLGCVTVSKNKQVETEGGVGHSRRTQEAT